jgi:hypothetical protein
LGGKRSLRFGAFRAIDVVGVASDYSGEITANQQPVKEARVRPGRQYSVRVERSEPGGI